MTVTFDEEDFERVKEALDSEPIAGAHTLERLATPALRIVATRTQTDTLPIGASRFGGTPDVPATFAWPSRDGRPLTFLAQLELAEVKMPELPEHGWLLFFYDVQDMPWGFDPRDAGGAAVVFLDSDRSALRRIDHPAVDETAGPFAACRLDLTRVIDLPHEFDSVVEAAGIRVQESDSDGYQHSMSLLSGVEDGATYHHLLGHPQLVQDDIRRECQLVTNGIYCGDPSGYQSDRAKALLVDAASEWKLLLQLDTDEEGPGWCWGDVGRIYFSIRRSDLEARAFDKAWLVLQCY
jgi:uncharacterized protein YwqG